MAAKRLDPAQHVTVYDDEWLPELTYILNGDEARPITRLYHGMRYSLGILVSARRIAVSLPRETAPPVQDGLIARLAYARIRFIEARSDVRVARIRAKLEAQCMPGEPPSH